MLHFSYTHTGQKTEDEDCFTISDGYYVNLRRGWWSQQRGDCEFNYSRILGPVCSQINSSEHQIQNILKKAVYKLHSLVEHRPEFRGTATTLAAVFLYSGQGLLTSHNGDSRIFLVWPFRKEFWHTWYHSLVGDLV